MKHHQTEWIRLSEHKEQLLNIQKELIIQKNNFEKNPNARSVYLQRYGYAPADKKTIRIVSLNAANNINRPTGQLLYAQKPSFQFSEDTIKVIATIFASIVLVSLFVFDYYSEKTRLT